MNVTIKIESESKGPIISGTEYVKDNSDVWVVFENGEEYVATFFTYENIVHLREKNKETGECLNGRYFWASDMIIVDSIEREEIESVIKELLENEEFFFVFRKLENP